jgi:two-component system alkaline phosphatase synthesis response regulator PhoP
MSNLDILVVDDEPHIRRPLSYLFKKSGYNVDTAKDGEEALDKIYQHHPKLIFLDIMLPKKDGYEVCSQLRQHDEFNDVYIAMLSAKGQSADQKLGLQKGANKYIAKPFNSHDILKLAQRVCRGEPEV